MLYDILVSLLQFMTFTHFSSSKVWFVLLVFNDIFSTNRLYRKMGVLNIYKLKKKHSLPPGLCGDNLLTM